MSKISSHDPFGNLKHKLWPKERPGVKLAIWLLTIKSRESPQFPCVQVACHILLKNSRQRLDLFLDLISIGGLHKKLWALKVAGVLTLGISGLPLGNPGTKCYLGAGPVARHRVYYKGKVVASLRLGPCWVLWIRICPWLVLAPKVFHLCINQLGVWFVQIRVND
jgi:hypothetical protein